MPRSELLQEWVAMYRHAWQKDEGRAFSRVLKDLGIPYRYPIDTVVETGSGSGSGSDPPSGDIRAREARGPAPHHQTQTQDRIERTPEQEATLQRFETLRREHGATVAHQIMAREESA